MNTNIRSAMVLVAMFGLGACAHKPPSCTTLHVNEVAPAMGAGVALQPVFTGGSVILWRVYNLRNSDQLRAQGIGEGSTLKQVCGVSVGEIQATGSATCCGADSSREFEVTFEIAGQEKKFMIHRL